MDKIDYSGSLADTDISKCIDQYPRIMMVIHRRSVRQVLYQDSDVNCNLKNKLSYNDAFSFDHYQHSRLLLDLVVC